MTRQSGFKLIELALVVGVIGTITAISASRYVYTAKETDYRKAVATYVRHLQILHDAAGQYALNHVFRDDDFSVGTTAAVSLETLQSAGYIDLADCSLGVAPKCGTPGVSPLGQTYAVEVAKRLVDGAPSVAARVTEGGLPIDTILTGLGLALDADSVHGLKKEVATELAARRIIAGTVSDSDGTVVSPTGSWSLIPPDFSAQTGQSGNPVLTLLWNTGQVGSSIDPCALPNPPDVCPTPPDDDDNGGQDLNDCDIVVPDRTEVNASMWDYSDAQCPAGLEEVWRFNACNDGGGLFPGSGGSNTSFLLGGTNLYWASQRIRWRRAYDPGPPATLTPRGGIVSGDLDTVEESDIIAGMTINGVVYGTSVECYMSTWVFCNPDTDRFCNSGDIRLAEASARDGGTGVLCCNP